MFQTSNKEYGTSKRKTDEKNGIKVKLNCVRYSEYTLVS